MKRFVALLVLTAATLTVSACGTGSQSGNSVERRQQQRDTTNLVRNQPIPGYNYSQLRQNLIELESAQANGVQTTTFFFNMGVPDPIQSCPSIGAPIPTTTQLSNPQQENPDNSAFPNNGGGNVVLDQMDPTGVYTGQSTGTYVMCIGANGKPYADYWEGFVQTIFGPAKWDTTTHTAQLIGSPSFKFTGLNH